MRTEAATVGWDIGGAHLKFALIDARGALRLVRQLPCPLWQGTPKLADALRQAAAELPADAHHVITMTGEMADCFATREHGVAAILDTFAAHMPGEARVYAGSTGLLAPHAALAAAHAVASANWRATAQAVAQVQRDALLIDIGSTTSDLIPLQDGRVAAQGHDDATRLAHDELLYTGVARTPLMALAQRWPFEGGWTRICNEHFATTADLYRLTGELDETCDQYPAADQGDKTLEGSARRLARMLGRDAACAPPAAWRELAHWLRERQLAELCDAVAALDSRAGANATAPIVGAGAGAFLARTLAARLGRPYRRFGELLNAAQVEHVDTCAPAVAVAWLGHHG